jgi:hypothetical protein
MVCGRFRAKGGVAVRAVNARRTRKMLRKLGLVAASLFLALLALI